MRARCEGAVVVVVVVVVVAALLAAVVVARAEVPEDPVADLYRRYRELRLKDDYKNAKFRILRQLGSIDSAASREVLFKILRTTRSKDERVIATLSLGRVADLETTKAWCKWMERNREPPLLTAFAKALGRVQPLDVHRWMADEALGTRSPELAWALAEAQVVLRTPEAAPALAALFGNRAKFGAPAAAAAVRALGAIGGEEASAVLLAAAAHPEPLVRRAAAAAIAFHDPRSTELDAAVRELFRGNSAQVRRAAFRAAGRAKREDLVPDLIIGLESDPRLRNRFVAYAALKAISGRDFSHDVATWRRWWKDRGSEDPGSFGEPRKYTYARYYGLGVHTDRVVFVVDVSGSMNWSYHRKPSRIDVARRELKRVIGQIHPKSRFNVVVYSTKVRSWQKREVEATPANIVRALRWSARVMEEPEGDTYAYDALEKTFLRNPAFDTVFFLSDGWPSHGDYISNEGIIAAVSAWNRDRDAVIHTIALTLENVDRGRPQSSQAKLREMKAFLRQLAASTGGECKVVTDG